MVIAGGGVLGTMHAVMARRRGFEVVHLEREAEARGASVRNFGLVWVSGRKAGPELSLALRARELWAELGTLVPGIGFRAAGSLTLATGDAELALLKEAAALPDADRREFELLDRAAVRAVNPALRGEFAGGLFCRADAIVEPRQVLPALRGHLTARGEGPRGEGRGGYEWLPGREVTEIAANAVRDHTGAWHRCDLVVLCPGAAHTGVAGRYLARGGPSPVRRVRLQMMQTEPLAERITTALADGDSLRYYPAYDLPGREQLPPQAVAAAAGPRAAAAGPAGRRRAHHRRHARIRRAVRVRPGRRRLRAPARPGRDAARRVHPPGTATLGRGLQRGKPRGGRSRAVPPGRGRAGRDPGHRPGRPRHDLFPGDSGRNIHQG